MAKSCSSLLSSSLCFLFFCYGSFVRLGFSDKSCRFDQLDALDPMQRAPSQAGVTEYYDVHNEQLRCAGLSVRRRIIEPYGLVLPSYSNAPALVYIVQGGGLAGVVFPGCPETFQSFRFQYEEGMEECGSEPYERFTDEHHKVHRFRQGDIIALPAGITRWFYNDGDFPIVAVTVFDTSNSANQLDPQRREFYLAGKQQRDPPYGEEEQMGSNIFSGFDPDALVEAFGVSQEVVARLQSRNDERGEIVRVEHGRLTWLSPSSPSREEEDMVTQSNGLEETLCAMKIRKNIDNPMQSEIYNPQGGRLARVHSQNFPILNIVQMGATRVVLRRNAMLAPYWCSHAHSVLYVTEGRGWVQVVDNRGKSVFDGELRHGQILMIPQNYVMAKKARREGFGFISFKTNHNAVVNRIIGKTSVFRAMPVDVLANSYRLYREEARKLKFSRGTEMAIFAPSMSSERYYE